MYKRQFLSSALGFVFWSYALEHAEKVSDVTNFMYISPIVAAIVAAFLLGEIPNMGLYIGCLLYTSGVVGAGHIGMEVIKVAKALGMNILVHTRTPKADGDGIRYVCLLYTSRCV